MHFGSYFSILITSQVLSCCKNHESFRAVAKRKKENKGKNGRFPKQKLSKSCHQGQIFTVFVMLANHGELICFSMFHGPSTLKFIHRPEFGFWQNWSDYNKVTCQSLWQCVSNASL